jgi:magnesium transporter
VGDQGGIREKPVPADTLTMRGIKTRVRDRRERKKLFIEKLGQPPGTLREGAGPEGTARPAEIRIFRYTEGSYTEDLFTDRDTDPFSRPELFRPSGGEVLWVDVIGVADGETLTKMGELFGIHPLVLEDIQNVDQRPKFEDYGDYYFTVIKMLSWDEENSRAENEQVSLLMGADWVVSFQEHRGDTFEFIRNRIRNKKGRVRSAGSDYLHYALLDSMVDYYFTVLEEVEEMFDRIEEEILSDRSRQTASNIHHITKQVSELRRSLLPCREVVYSLQKTELTLIIESTRIYYRDIYDHVFRILDTQEILREKLGSLFSVYTANVSNRMNSIMKILTIISTIFIPLTFIAGIYGMNFVHMPELESPLGYPITLGAMGLIAVGMIVFFWRKGWLK